ncbi:MAG TPA: AAA family ATPase, partial [Polyangia bacterium]|nr:AAA family ATPase [Polyangia bacterium]
PDGSVVATLVAQGSAMEQAMRAARTALAMRAALPEAALVLATGRGSTEGRMPVGEVIDRAIALLPQPGEQPPAPETQGSGQGLRPVRIDAVTAGFLDARFEIGKDAAGRLELRGEREAADDGERGERARRLLGKPTPCVGRERELALLGAYFQECTQEMVARTILVTGDPGVGKSRLGYEFLHEARRAAADAEIWIAQGSPLGAGSPLGMIGQLLRRAAGVREGEPLELRRDKLRARVARLGLGAEERRVTEFVGEMAGTPFDDGESVQLHAARSDAQLMRDQMRQAWCDLLAAEAALHPVIIVLEDLHWGDMPSVQWIDVALRNLQERPLLVLALARPEVHDRFPKLWLERGRQEIRLGQLPRKASERLVRQVLGEGVEKQVVEQVIRQAGGNAFFLEELIRAIAEGQARALPETVLATVQVRLEALPSEARRLVRAASIFGETFWRGGLAVLLGQGRATASIDAQLESLANQELITSNVEGRFPGEAEYRFRHAFVREAGYAMLTENDRALGHRLAGEWLEQAGEQDALVLAVHFEYGKQAERAAVLYHRAAAEAHQANDLTAAIERGERAALCGATGELLGEVRLIQSEARHWRAEYAAAARHADEALRLIPRASLSWFRAVSLAAEIAFMSGDVEGAAALSDALERALRGTPSDPAQLAAVAAATKNLLYSGRLASTRRLVQQIEAAVGTAVMNEPLAAGYVYDTLCYHAAIMGEPAAAHAAAQAGIASYMRAGDTVRADKMRLQAALVAIRLGRHREIEAELHTAIERFLRLGIHSLVVWARYILGSSLLRSGALEEAHRQIVETLAGLEPTGNSMFMARTRHVLAHILLEMGRLAEAEAAARQAAEGEQYAAALAMLAQVLLRRGQREAALAAAKEAWVALMHLGATLEDGGELVPLVLAEALAASGDEEGARRVIGMARERLLTLAERMEEPLRRSYLEEVAENARTLELARAWLGD